MKRDFTVKTLKNLFGTFLERSYRIMPVIDFLETRPEGKVCILRHDVDRDLPSALSLAETEHAAGIKATYYIRPLKYIDFRMVKRIAELGHEIGYHYEVLAKTGGDYEKARSMFEEELKALRSAAPVQTACMHGSPLSRWDNRKFWERFSLSDFGLIGEPYLTIDYAHVLYVTDTGRGWNRAGGNVRDAVMSGMEGRYRSTFHMMREIENGRFPLQALVNIHPERWHDGCGAWLRELVMQNIKNAIKQVVLKRAKKSDENCCRY